MSNIYEALQRAELEQKTVAEQKDVPIAEAPPNHGSASSPVPTRGGSLLDLVAEFDWSPNLKAFPSLSQFGPGLEQFRSLRSRIYECRAEAPLKTILISSGVPSEGKSFVAVNLAVTLARNSAHKVLLIDGDLRRANLHSLLGSPNNFGLTDYLCGNSDLKSIMMRGAKNTSPEKTAVFSMPNLALIPSGQCRDNSSELIANHRIEDLVAEASPFFDWILIDSPPVTVVSDAVDLARAADAVLLIGRQAKTRYPIAQRTQAAFGKSRILGFVLNDVKDPPRRESYHYYYGYGNGGQRAEAS